MHTATGKRREKVPNKSKRGEWKCFSYNQWNNVNLLNVGEFFCFSKFVPQVRSLLLDTRLFLSIPFQSTYMIWSFGRLVIVFSFFYISDIYNLHYNSKEKIHIYISNSFVCWISQYFYRAFIAYIIRWAWVWILWHSHRATMTDSTQFYMHWMCESYISLPWACNERFYENGIMQMMKMQK